MILLQVQFHNALHLVQKCIFFSLLFRFSSIKRKIFFFHKRIQLCNSRNHNENWLARQSIVVCLPLQSTTATIQCRRCCNQCEIIPNERERNNNEKRKEKKILFFMTGRFFNISTENATKKESQRRMKSFIDFICALLL